MDNAMAGTILFMFLTVALCALLFWDNIGRRLWYDLSDALGDLAHWLRSRPWPEAFTALRTGQISYGATAASESPQAPVVRLPRDYVTQAGSKIDSREGAFSAFERAERAPFVQGVQPERDGDIIRLDTIARLMAAGLISESTAITTVYDGRQGVPKISKGGSVAYVSRRDELRKLAATHGWKAPEVEPEPTPRIVPISDGKGGHFEL